MAPLDYFIKSQVLTCFWVKYTSTLWPVLLLTDRAITECSNVHHAGANPIKLFTAVIYKFL